MLPGFRAGPRAGGHGGNGYWEGRAHQPGFKARRSGEIPGRKSALEEAPWGFRSPQSQREREMVSSKTLELVNEPGVFLGGPLEWGSY